MTAHKHAALMAQYAEDALETETPWAMWELKEGSGSWGPISRHPIWRQASQYRRKPQTININGYEVPEPCRLAPGLDEMLWKPAMSGNRSLLWDNTLRQRAWLQAGLLHLTKEAADIHGKALLSFTQEQSE